MSQQPALDESPAELPQPNLVADEKKKKDKKEKKKESRGIETMYRVTYQNHISLSQLADNKANMLISINGLIISIMISIIIGIATRTGAVSWAVAPLLVLITGCLVSLGFAVIAARPRLNRSTVTIDQVRNETGNLLFFGQFTSMPLAEFQESLRVLMQDKRLLYAHLGRQLYLMGQALNGKYRYLQIAYSAFLASTVLATALFVLMYATGRFNSLPPIP